MEKLKKLILSVCTCEEQFWTFAFHGNNYMGINEKYYHYDEDVDKERYKNVFTDAFVNATKTNDNCYNGVSFAHVNKFLERTGYAINCVYRKGGEDQGNDASVVLSLTNLQTNEVHFYTTDFYYQSYEGLEFYNDFNEPDAVYEVFPYEVTLTLYKRAK